MADKELSDLPEATSAGPLDIFHVKDSLNVDKKITLDNLSQTMSYATQPELTTATMTANPKYTTSSVGKTVVQTKEFSTGNGGGGVYDIISGTGTANGRNIIAHDTNSISFVLRETYPLDVRQYGVNPDSSDNQAATQQIADNNVPSLRFTGAGSYTYLSTVTFNSDIIIEFDEGAVVDGTDGGFTGDDIFLFQGSTSALPDLNANVSRGDLSLTFVSSHGLAAGDLFLIEDPANSSWSGFRADYKAGEYCEVASVSGNTVNLKNRLYDSYTVAAVDLKKQNSVKAKLVNPQFLGSTSNNLITFNYCRGVRVVSPYLRHSNNTCIRFRNCYDTDVIIPDVINEGDGGDDYGILWTNCQHGRITAGQLYGRRHSVSIGGGTGSDIMPCRDIKTTDATLKNDVASGSPNADFHGHTEDGEYIDCTIYGGANFQGKNTGYRGCTIYNYEGGEQVTVKAAEIKGGKFWIEDCKLYNFGDPSATGRSIIDVGGNSNAITADTVEDVTLIFKGNTLHGTSMGSGGALVSVRNRGTSSKINVDINDFTLDMNDFNQILRMDLISGTADSDFIIVDDIKCNLTGKLLAGIDNNYLVFPLKMHAQAGTEELTTSTGASFVNGTPVTFRYQYPKLPSLQMARSNRTYIGNRVGIAHANPLSTTGLTPVIATDDNTNFSAALDVDVSWRVGIDEA